MLNQAIRVRDLATDAKWKPITDAETMLVHVVMPKAEEAPAAERPRRLRRRRRPAEPEVIKKGKTGQGRREEKK